MLYKLFLLYYLYKSDTSFFLLTFLFMLLFTRCATSNASRHFKSPLAMGRDAFKPKHASSVSISEVIDTGVNNNLFMSLKTYKVSSSQCPFFYAILERLCFIVIIKERIDLSNEFIEADVTYIQSRPVDTIHCCTSWKDRVRCKINFNAFLLRLFYNHI